MEEILRSEITTSKGISFLIVVTRLYRFHSPWQCRRAPPGLKCGVQTSHREPQRGCEPESLLGLFSSSCSLLTPHCRATCHSALSWPLSLASHRLLTDRSPRLHRCCGHWAPMSQGRGVLSLQAHCFLPRSGPERGFFLFQPRPCWLSQGLEQRQHQGDNQVDSIWKQPGRKRGKEVVVLAVVRYHFVLFYM